MYCLKKFNFFKVDLLILALFNDSVVKSVWKYCLLCWGGNASKGDGNGWQDFGSVSTDLLIKKLHRVLDDLRNPLYNCLLGQLIARS